METFIYGDLKKASLNKDFEKVKTLGPYAFALSYILGRSYREKLINDKNIIKKCFE